MHAQRTTRRAELTALLTAVPVALVAFVGAFLLAVLVPEATDPAAWGTPPAVSWAAAMLIGFIAAAVAALLAGRLLTHASGRPHTSHDVITLAVFMAIGAAAVSVWAFGVGIGFDPVPQWLDAVMIGAGAIALFGAVVVVALISDRLRRGAPAQE